MRSLHRLAALAAVIAVVTSCAAKLPPADTFHPSAWARVEALLPGTRVEVRYVSTASGRPLRQHFEGTLLVATGDIFEIETTHGVQRLLPQRVTRVAAGRLSGDPVAVTALTTMLGVVLGTLAGVDRNAAERSRRTWVGALIGGAIGASLMRRAIPGPVVIYSRRGSL